jgi:lipid II:glycine glycyltransferase (peptidoglycan interpeptide bridge formation enzyme)
LRRNGVVQSIAQARIKKVPIFNIGIAYVQWGPLWRSATGEANVDTFRQAIRALRNEFAHKRGFVLRLFPVLFEADAIRCATVLAEEGFAPSAGQSRGRTILMDLKPSLTDLREGMLPHWKRELKIAEKNGLELVEGTEEELFDLFIDIYKEMVSRKKFIEPNNIYQFRQIQAHLPAELKMRIMLCKSGKAVSSGLIYSAIGNTAVYLFGATSNAGLKTRGSYRLQWELLNRLKVDGISVYNLNGINATKNPGTYKFKNDLAGKNGKDMQFLGRFDAPGSFLSSSCIECGDSARAMYQSLRR